MKKLDMSDINKKYVDSSSYKIERWLDHHNHKLELIRTVGTIITILIALRVFHII
jgi:hypothetical protein